MGSMGILAVLRITETRQRILKKNKKIEKMKVELIKRIIEEHKGASIENVCYALSGAMMVEDNKPTFEIGEKPVFEIGEKVRVISNSPVPHAFEVGTIVEVLENTEPIFKVYGRANFGVNLDQKLSTSQIEKL